MGYPADLPVALVSAGCTPRQRVIETRVDAAAEVLRKSDLETPVLAVVGWVVTLRKWLYAPAKREIRFSSEIASEFETGFVEPI